MKHPTTQTLPPLVQWLYLCCAMIFVMALLGAITRLTESGLSITTWDPITGTVPPLSEEAWRGAFENYKEIPQYKLLNQGMTLEEFKSIYFWEWFHRLWGRAIGFVFALPFFYFFMRRRMSNSLAVKLATIFALGSVQAFIGWFMVKSGLADRTSVSPVRLALHLVIALLTYSLLLWTAMGLTYGGPKPEDTKKPRQRLGWWALIFLTLTIIWGALVAGLHAGLVYNTWPLMDGWLMPPESFTITDYWQNFFVNTALVQFTHRWLGPTTGLLILIWSYKRLRAATNIATRRWLLALCGMVFVQIGLGISTLLSEVNIILATLHQAGAITLLTLLLVNLRRPDRP